MKLIDIIKSKIKEFKEIITNLNSNRFNEYNPDFNWKALSEIDYISVVKAKSIKSAHKGFKTVSHLRDYSTTIYKLNIVVDSQLRDYVTILKANKKEPIMTKAFELKEYFNSKIYDCTTYKKTWIN